MNDSDHRYDIDLEVDETSPGGVDLDGLRTLVEAVLEAEELEPGTGLAIRLSDDASLRELNRTHRGADEPTDVLSFGAEEGEAFPAAPGEPRYLGDIAVSLEAVERQAAEAGLAAKDELAHVVLHGVLHLLGYDHLNDADDAAMRAREEAFLGADIHRGRHAHADE